MTNLISNGLGPLLDILRIDLWQQQVVDIQVDGQRVIVRSVDVADGFADNLGSFG